MSIENVVTVQEIYGAFGRGDLAAITGRVAPDVRWGFAAPLPGVPWHEPVRSADELGRFFASLEAVQFTRFEPREFVHCGPHVMVDVRLEYVVRRTGRRVAMDQIHWWTLDGGKVAAMVHYEDTAQVAAAVA